MMPECLSLQLLEMGQFVVIPSKACQSRQILGGISEAPVREDDKDGGTAMFHHGITHQILLNTIQKAGFRGTSLPIRVK